jgi:glycosyltransferase involved in cell wall biosynthesis
MRVLVIGANLDRPEANIFAGLSGRGVSLHYLGMPAPEHLKLLQEAGIKVTFHSFTNRFDLRGIRLIKEIVRSERIEIVYALSNRGLSCSVLARLDRSVRLFTYRGTVGHISWFDPSSWLTYLNPRVSKILCVSDAVGAYMREVGIAAEKVIRIYKGHDTAWYQQACPPPRSSLGLPEDAFVVGCTAVMRPVKGVDVLIKAVGSLLQELPKLHLLLIGPIKDKEIERLLKMFPEPSRLHLTGYRADAAALAPLCDATVMASKTREGFPKSIVESMSQGIPAIVTAVGGMPELVDNGSAGVLIPPSNVEALADAIRSLYNDRSRAKNLGALGEARIKAVFNIQTTIEETYRVFSGEVSPQN